MNSFDLSSPEIRHRPKAAGAKEGGQYHGKYFWDGKRFWISGDGTRYTPLRATSLPMHLKGDGVTDTKVEVAAIKKNFLISAALPIALHPVGNLIQVGNHRILSTNDILSSDDQEPGQYPFISKIMEKVLGSEVVKFTNWLARAMAYTRGRSTIQPEIPCLVGDCETRKGILANLANMVLIGWWCPNEISVFKPRLEASEIESLSELVWVLNMTDCLSADKSCERNLQKLLKLNQRGKVVEDVELRVRKIIVIRCHSTYWKPLESIVERNAPNGLIVFQAMPGLSLRENGEPMGPLRIEELVQKEIRQFRHHILSIAHPQ